MDKFNRLTGLYDPPGTNLLTEFRPLKTDRQYAYTRQKRAMPDSMRDDADEILAAIALGTRTRAAIATATGIEASRVLFVLSHLADRNHVTFERSRRKSGGIWVAL